MDRPLSVFSIEAVFSHMKIEKVWEVRKKNAVLRNVINTTQPSKMNKWRLHRLEIKEDRIGHADKMEDPAFYSLLKGTNITRWLTCGILIIKNISEESLQKSLVPVGRTLCKDTVSLDLMSSVEVPEDFIKLVGQLVSFTSQLRALSVHVPKLKEAQLCQLLDNLNWNSTNFISELVFLSVSASSEVSEVFMEHFMRATKCRNNRMLLIKSPTEGEELRVPTEAVKFMFTTDYLSTRNQPRDQIFIETMEKTKASDLFAELSRAVPRGYSIEEEGGRMEFRKSDGICPKVLIVLNTV